MVTHRAGQATAEFLLMLGFLTLIGIWIVQAFVGSGSGSGGSVHIMTKTAVTNIGSD